MKNLVLPVIVGFALIIAYPAQADQYRSITMEFGADRAGADYKNIELSSNDPFACQILCAQDGNCKAYTFVPAGILTFEVTTNPRMPA